MSRRHPMFLGGEWRESGAWMEVRSPYDDQVVGVVAQAGEREAAEAVDRATSAFAATRDLPSHKRAEVLNKIAEGLDRRKEEIARTIALEAGKPISEARVEAGRAAFTFRCAAEEAKRIGGEMIPLDLLRPSEGRWGITRRFPVGPILAISPFNFPLNLVAHKVAPAIAAGNPIILKPASKTPITALLLAEVVKEAGLPDGGFSVLPCPGKVAEGILADDRIKMLTFTGSPPVGWSLKAKAVKKKVILELGGNAGVIVHEDAPLEFAVSRCVFGAFAFSGQVCISVQRIYAHEPIYQAFLDRFVPQVRNLKMGDPLDESTKIGPMIDLGAAEQTEQWVAEAVGKGAKVLCGGKRQGRFFEPTVLTDVDPATKVSCREVFAPVVSVAPYRNFEDVLSAVNDSVYGLQAGVFTRDLARAFQAFETLEVGGVILNDVPTYRIDHMPYGGVKESGFGREGIHYTIEEMTELRLLVVNRNF
ncbi:MAG: aldehyde dehydrogenase family protein [Nitrospirae bacterium]|nr:aldehyde dehydrogenase family protein [Nitrospirota bacterium]